MSRIGRSRIHHYYFPLLLPSCKRAFLGCTLFGIRDSHSFLHFLSLLDVELEAATAVKVRRPATIDVLMTTNARCK